MMKLIQTSTRRCPFDMEEKTERKLLLSLISIIFLAASNNRWLQQGRLSVLVHQIVSTRTKALGPEMPRYYVSILRTIYPLAA